MPSRPRSSRHRYLAFVEDYRRRRLDDIVDADNGNRAAVATDSAPPGERRLKRRQYLPEDLGWLRPHRKGVLWVVLLALAVAGLQMVEPLFMRVIVDPGLLKSGLAAAGRGKRLNGG